ncbi:MAG: SpoIIE family protein phosphatase [Planctomycetota bacterium]|nr:SpoIIE family protein phosphatase [Planctomycetota bacterium]
MIELVDDTDKVRRIAYSSEEAKIEVFAKGTTTIMTISGKFSPKVGEKVSQILSTLKGDVALEMVDLSPIDVSLLSFLRSVSQRVSSRGWRFFLIHPPLRLRDMIQISYSDGRFNIVEDISELPEETAEKGGSVTQQTRHILSVRKDALQHMEWEKAFASARDRVRAFFPLEPPQMERFEAAFLYMPSDIIGGDFFDFIPLGKGLTGVLIGDVSGHGIDAAVMVGMVKKVFEIWAKILFSPAKVVVQCNDDISSELQKNAFVTSIYGILDENNMTFTFVRAGHTLPIKFNPRKKIPPTTLSTRGLGIGLASRAAFEAALEEYTLELNENDYLFLFTDGIVEAQGRNGEEFGIKRLLDALSGEEMQSPRGVVMTVLRKLYDFTTPKEQDDDITAICISANYSKTK